MHGTLGVHDRDEKYKILVENPEGNDSLGSLGLMTLNKLVCECGLGPVVDRCKRGNEFAGSTEGGSFSLSLSPSLCLSSFHRILYLRL
jgi:hypothetical protein